MGQIPGLESTDCVDASKAWRRNHDEYLYADDNEKQGEDGDKKKTNKKKQT